MRTATKIVMMSSSPALKFTTVGYSATWTPPTITAATLTDVQVKWIRPDGTSFTGKTPAMTNFSQLGNYQLRIKKWSRVTAFSFAPGGASRNWLSHINLDVMFPKMTGLLSCALRDMPSLVDIVTTWKLPSSMTSIAAFLQGCTGLTGVVTGWVLPTGVTNISYFLYGCTGLTGVFPTPAALSVCTSYQDIIKNNLLITGDVSTWTWRTNIINAAMSNTRLTYGTGQSLRTNVKNVLVFSMATCNLTQSMVDAVLVDLDTSAATGLVITLNGTGNAVPSAAGLAAKANILAKGGTVTVNT